MDWCCQIATAKECIDRATAVSQGFVVVYRAVQTRVDGLNQIHVVVCGGFCRFIKFQDLIRVKYVAKL